MDWMLILQIVGEIVKMVMDKSQPEALDLAADLQAVALMSNDPVDRLFARAAICAANGDTAGQEKLLARIERFAAVAEKHAAQKGA